MNPAPTTPAPAGDLLFAAEPGSEPVGRRERKKAATWLSLHEAALALTREKGFDAVTVEEICERADVSVRTFFNYFPCKEDAVLGGSAGFDRIRESMRTRPADEAPLQAFHNAYVLKLRELSGRTEMLRVRYELIEKHPALRAREFTRLAEFETGLAEVIAERTGLDVDRDPYPRLVAAVGMSVLRTSFRAWLHASARDSLAAIVDRNFSSVAAGLPAPPPRKRRATAR